MRTPRTLQQFNDHPYVDQAFRDDDGYWVWLKPGYWSSNMECGTLREDTVKELVEQWSWVEMAPCDYLERQGREYMDEAFANYEANGDKLRYLHRYYFVTRYATSDDGMKVVERAQFHYHNPNGLITKKRAMCDTIGQWVDDGLIPTGWHLAYGSFADYHDRNVIHTAGLKRGDRWDLNYHVVGLQEDIDRGYSKLGDFIMQD